jgi:hypothetical protein
MTINKIIKAELPQNSIPYDIHPARLWMNPVKAYKTLKIWLNPL